MIELIAEQDEGRRARFGLGHIADLDAAAGHGGRRRLIERRGEPAIELARGDALVPHFMRADDRFHQLLDADAGEATDRNDGTALDLGQQAIGLVAQGLQLLAGLADEIPFVETDDERPALAFDEIDDAQIGVRRGSSRR